MPATLTWHGLPYDLLLASCMVTALFICGCVIRLVYLWTPHAGAYADVHANVAVRGFKVLKVVAGLTTICSLTLIGRANVPTTAALLSAEASNQGLWCLVRLGVCLILELAVFLFDSHPVFRWTASVGIVPMIMADLMSQNAFVREIWCMTEEICIYDQTLMYELELWAWRDTISASLLFICVGLSIWLTALHGLCHNHVYLPRWEHRVLAKKLDAIVGKPTASPVLGRGPGMRRFRSEANLLHPS